MDEDITSAMSRRTTPENLMGMNSARASLIATGVIFTLIGTATMTMRSLSLLWKKRVAGIDEYAIWTAYIFSLAFATASFESIRWGVGFPTPDLPLNWTTSVFKCLYAVQTTYFIALYFTKLSVMLVYFRLATELKNILYRGSQVMTVVLTLQFLASIVATAVQCVPLEKYFDPEIPGHCINITAFLYSSNVFTIITDLMMLALPLSTVWQAKLSQGQKIAVSCAFLAGGISTLASCIRLYSIRIYTLSDDPIRDAAPINIWSFVELNIAMCCASIAAIRPLFTRGRVRVASTEITCRSSPDQDTFEPKPCKHQASNQESTSSDTIDEFVPDHIFTCELHRQLSSAKPHRMELSISKCTHCGGRCSKRFELPTSHDQHGDSRRGESKRSTKHELDAFDTEIV